MSSDPEMEATSPIVGFVNRMAQQGQLTNAARPHTPLYTCIEEVLGDEIHQALSGSVPDAVVLSRARDKIDALLDAEEKFRREVR